MSETSKDGLDMIKKAKNKLTIRLKPYNVSTHQIMMKFNKHPRFEIS
jgi:hypothetical protein